MRIRAKLVLTALAAAVMLSALVGTASANRISISNRFLRILFRELTFTSNNREAGIEVICPVTLEGSFHSNTIPKISGLLIGYITRAERRFESCAFAGGAEGVTIDNETLPWHIQYESFAGTLPRIERITLRLINAQFRLRAFGIPCRYRSSAAQPARGLIIINTTTGQAEPLQALPETGIPLIEGGFLCPNPGFFRGNGQIRLLNNLLQLIFVRLI